MADMTFKANLLPVSDLGKNLGSSTLRWNIYGNLTGNASTADKWKTTRTLTIGATGKSVDGSANVSWSLAEIIGAAKGSLYLPIYWTGSAFSAITTNSVLTNLASTAAASTYAASPRPGVTGILPIANGGTGANNRDTAHWNLLRACYMFDNTADFNSYPWHKIASLTLTAAYHDRDLILLVNDAYNNTNYGILKCRVRVDANVHCLTQSLNWLVCTSDINLASYVLRYTNGTNLCIFEIWAKVEAQYRGYCFTILSETARTGNNSVSWVLYNSEGHGSASYTSGTGGTNSAAPNMAGNITGNAATATKATQDLNGLNIASGYLPLTGGTLTGELTRKVTTVDASKTNNNISSTIYPTTFNITDNAGRIMCRQEAVILSGGTIRSYWYVRNYNTSGGRVVQKGIHIDANKDGSFTAGCDSPFYGAVWNDYAEYRESNITEPGRCLKETGNGNLILTTKRLEKGCEIISDTFGFAIGQSDICKTPTAATGRVLAYLLEPIEEAKKNIGLAVCSGPNGTVSIMTDEECRLWPQCIIGTISEVPDYEIWHAGTLKGNKFEEIQVNGRIWIRIR